MKQFLLSSVTLSHLVFGGFPPGEYAGVGTKTWVSGASKSYGVRVFIGDSKLKFHYEFEGAAPLEFELSVANQEYGFFTIGHAGGATGSGYCVRSGCHYTIPLGSGATEEWTFVFSGNRLLKLGSLVTETSKNYWEETLEKRDP